MPEAPRAYGALPERLEARASVVDIVGPGPTVVDSTRYPGPTEEVLQPRIEQRGLA